MPTAQSRAQVFGQIGGLTRAAMCVDNRAHTQPARDARFQKYLDQIPPEITDPAEREIRAVKLRAADMRRLALKSADVRRNKKTRQALDLARAELDILERELNASGLDNCGSDGTDRVAV